MRTDYYKIIKAEIFILPGIIRLFLVIILVSVSSNIAIPQENRISEKWSDKTAFLTSEGKWESGIFQSFRFGLNKKIELRSNALLIPVLPNAGIKFSIRSGEGLILASEHSISCPTLFLNIVSFKGTGGLISPQYSFPFIMTMSNTFLASKWIGSSSLLTADAGIAFTLRTGKPDYQSSIDIPFVYQRMAHYYKGVSIKSGLSFKGAFIKNVYYEELIRIILITRNHDNIFFENAGSVMWTSQGSIRIKAGYLFSWGDYPFGNHLQIWPAFDLIFGSKSKKTEDR
jgi:hypothetical protein